MVDGAGGIGEGIFWEFGDEGKVFSGGEVGGGEGETVGDVVDLTTILIVAALDADVTPGVCGAVGNGEVRCEVEVGGEGVEFLRPAGAVGVPVEFLIIGEVGDDIFKFVF